MSKLWNKILNFFKKEKYTIVEAPLKDIKIFQIKNNIEFFAGYVEDGRKMIVGVVAENQEEIREMAKDARVYTIWHSPNGITSAVIPDNFEDYPKELFYEISEHLGIDYPPEDWFGDNYEQNIHNR